MKQVWRVMGMALIVMLMVNCNGKKNSPNSEGEVGAKEAEIPDSTIYGVCGSGTSMHSLELITDQGDTLTYIVNNDDSVSILKGGLLTGDRMAVVGFKNEYGEMQASQVINITTLLGRWTSIDKNFEIQEGGVVASSVKAESNPWTTWKITNCKLVLNTDTFDIDKLGADSLYLENSQGIYVFKRQLN